MRHVRNLVTAAGVWLLAVAGAGFISGCKSAQVPPTTQSIESALNLRIREAVAIDIGLSSNPKARAREIYTGASDVLTAVQAGADLSNLQTLAENLIIARFPPADQAKARVVTSVVIAEIENDLGIDPSQPVPIQNFEQVRAVIVSGAQTAMDAAKPYM